MTRTKLKELEIDVVTELHKVRKKYAKASSVVIEKGAEETLLQIKKRKRQKLAWQK